MTYTTVDHTDVVATSDDGKLRVILEPDYDCERPMDNDDGWVTSVLTRTHSRQWGYEWEAMRDPGDHCDAMRYFENEATLPRRVSTEDAFKRYMRLFHSIEVFGVEIVNGYRDTSSGLAWIEPSELDRVGIDLTNADDPAAVVANRVIEVEIAEHNRWAEGECYGYVVQKLTTWQKVAESEEDQYDPETRDQWEDTDTSCWGFIGREYAEQEATEALAGHR